MAKYRIIKKPQDGLYYVQHKSNSTIPALSWANGCASFHISLQTIVNSFPETEASRLCMGCKTLEEAKLKLARCKEIDAEYAELERISNLPPEVVYEDEDDAS